MQMVLLRVKAKRNIFFIKKLVVKERFFILLIRRDPIMRKVLQCSLYDFPGSVKGLNLSFTNSKEGGSDCGNWQKQTSYQSSKEYGNKSYRYQNIYLQEGYFKGMSRRGIVEEFLIDYRVFLLKPEKS